MWGKKKEKEGTADRQLSKRELREMQKKNVDEIEKVTLYFYYFPLAVETGLHFSFYPSFLPRDLYFVLCALVV